MKILYVVTGLGLGGAEKVVVDLADQMLERGHEVKIIYLRGNPEVKPRSNRIELIGLCFENPIDFFNAFKKLNETIRYFQPDIVHSHMIHSNIFVRLSRIGSSHIKKLICTAHNSNEGGRIRMLAYRLTNFLSDVNTNVSNDASEALIAKGAFSKNNLQTVYNGVDLNKFKNKNIKNDKCYTKILSVGRFNEQKDYPNLLKAILLLKDKLLNTNIKFYIAGDGELRGLIENLIHSYDIGSFIKLLGKRSDIPDLLNEADFFILPSKHEGLPTVIIEAMACQTYVIATDCGGSAEIMGETGMLVPVQDSLALANAISRALSLSDLTIQKNNLIARKRIEDNFSLQASVNKWLELYAN
jgi:glycosyltransferase involved in cell wall biosynthesis